MIGEEDAVHQSAGVWSNVAPTPTPIGAPTLGTMPPHCLGMVSEGKGKVSGIKRSAKRQKRQKRDIVDIVSHALTRYGSL